MKYKITIKIIDFLSTFAILSGAIFFIITLFFAVISFITWDVQGINFFVANLLTIVRISIGLGFFGNIVGYILYHY